MLVGEQLALGEGRGYFDLSGMRAAGSLYRSTSTTEFAIKAKASLGSSPGDFSLEEPQR